MRIRTKKPLGLSNASVQFEVTAPPGTEVVVDNLAGRGTRATGGFYALLFANSPRDAATGTKPADKAARYEFLVVGGAGMFGRARCFALIEPGAALSVAQERRALEPLVLKEAQVAVRRRRGITCYECAIPASAIAGIRLTVGREICFSALVHDPDGTGLRDWGEAAGLWASQRSRLAWCVWEGLEWGRDAPFDNKIEWGLCSSKR